MAGFYKVSFEAAEKIKKDLSKQKDLFYIIKPVVEKMASIVKRNIASYSVDKIYVVGGACCFKEFENVFKKELEIETIKPVEPLLITPLGIALHCNR